jgi:vitamin-K-epoxide reductase (warfarin-sensitive)
MPLGLDGHFYKMVLPVVLCECALWAYSFENLSTDPRTCQVVLSLLGLWWCFAALWVEVKIEQAYPNFDYEKPQDPEMKAYRPFCDFAPWATCSKVLMSPPGRFLRHFGIAKEGGGEGAVDTVRGLIDVPNPTLGVAYFAAHLFWPLLMLLPIPFLPELFLLACLFVGGMTIWLAYNLFFVLQDFCIVCISQYVVNFALIPMMYNMLHFKTYALDFGAVPKELLYPFLAMDAVMGIGVLALWLRGPAHARESARMEGYISILG